jgi:mRNA interferase RelE/StbE
MTGARYRVQTTGHRVEKEMAGIHPPDQERIIAAIRQLPDDPRPPGIQQLEPDVYRLRVGDYRVIYRVLDAEKVILIGRVARRSESTYRDLRRLFD